MILKSKYKIQELFGSAVFSVACLNLQKHIQFSVQIRVQMRTEFCWKLP